MTDTETPAKPEPFDAIVTDRDTGDTYTITIHPGQYVAAMARYEIEAYRHDLPDIDGRKGGMILMSFMLFERLRLDRDAPPVFKHRTLEGWLDAGFEVELPDDAAERIGGLTDADPYQPDQPRAL